MVIAAGAAEDELQKKKPPKTTQEERDFMETVPERSRGSLHNFSSIPCFNIKWGRQKQLRCVKDSADHHDFPTSSSSSLFHHRSPSGLNRSHSEWNSDRKRRSVSAAEDDGGFDAMREKLMLDLRTQVHQMQAAFLNGGKNSDVVSTAAAPAVEARPWNLRTRRAVCKEPNNVVNGSDRKPNFSPAKHAEFKSPSRKTGGELDGFNGGEGPRAKFSVSLSKQEIEEDFLAILGTRPARRPKKRPRYVQKQIDAVFPGFWLSEITADMYKVNEQPEAAMR